MLKRVIETLEGIDESIHNLYIQKDGKFHLDVEGNDKADGNWIPKSRFNEVIEQKKSAEGIVKTVADELIAQVPEEYRELVPDMAPDKQIKWLQSALKHGVFSDVKTQGPDGKRPGGKKETDFEGMSPAQMRKAGYKT